MKYFSGKNVIRCSLVLSVIATIFPPLRGIPIFYLERYSLMSVSLMSVPTRDIDIQGLFIEYILIAIIGALAYSFKNN